ncbi:FAD-dependent oxidoreductase [Streptococcus zalophi]|uniref:FAD-dependent oxidoreductase n=1 Tax=Streptococcus zalophi TaxID=640031 RepID=A0A934P7Y6_9STRE|nr:FAD-dependent oxidoreductase [Streptococcus zalophi]MBJ8349029.1 FAD-dependent oxidoreductase [Streptococcus zalophi]MCR8967820.1 FAD-dependent oxidoreductase [Streptococcus zalophi]
MTKVVIVGGVAGGMSAATRLRRLMEDAEIIVFEKGPFVSFANCGLPYYVSGEISDRDQLLVQTPERLQARFNLDVRPFHEVTAIDATNQTVTVRHDGKEFVETYDKLILSPGAKPFVPPIENIERATNVFNLRNVPDLDEIMAHIDLVQSKEAVIVGAGFIGLEMAENLVKKGLNVTIVEKAPHVLPALDEEMAAFVLQTLEANGIKVITSQSVVRFEEEGKSVVLENGDNLSSDLTILSVGIQPETTLAKEAGVTLGFRGGIVVDDHYETNLKNIYAVGDAIVVNHQISQEDALVSLASPANRQGRQVADVIAGLKRENKGSIGTAIVRVFDLSAATTGLSERIARNLGYDVSVVHTSGKDHASYYPGATDITLKLIFNAKTGQIYGAQGIGQKGVDKRIDVLATAIKGNLTIFDLPELELTYAPPFGSAKDPVNMIGYAAINIAEGLSQNIQWHELADELAKGTKLLDVRTTPEVKRGHFKDFVHIPLDNLRSRLNELDKSNTYIVSCHSGLRSYIAERLLQQEGFKVKNLDGAYSLYNAVRPKEIFHD